MFFLFWKTRVFFQPWLFYLWGLSDIDLTNKGFLVIATLADRPDFAGGHVGFHASKFGRQPGVTGRHYGFLDFNVHLTESVTRLSSLLKPQIMYHIILILWKLAIESIASNLIGEFDDLGNK